MDEFGGIPVDQAQPDEFGGIPVEGSNRNGLGAPLSDDSDQSGHQGSAGTRPIGDVATEAAENLIPSGVRTAESIYNAVRHPIKTIGALSDVGRGAGQELAHTIRGDSATHDLTPQEQAFEGVKSYFGNRYGSIPGFQDAVAKDPVGVMADLSVLFSGTGALARQVPGIGEKAADVAATAARASNPVVAATAPIAKLTSPIGRGAADVIGNLGTHTGAEPLKLAYQAGRQGGDASQAFLDNMRGNVPMEDVVSSAKAAVSQMRQAKNAAYREGMAGISKDPTVLSFEPVDKAMAKTANVKSFSGRSGTGPTQDLAKSTSDVRSDIQAAIDHWKGLDPADFHTPEGFDALKQQIGDIKDSLPYNTPQRLVAEQAYNAVRGAIVSQAPDYARVMKDYERASDAIDQVQRGLSLGKRATVDTSLRKLQSIMRNNVNTNYGYRGKLLDQLTDAGATNLPYELAGQSLSKLTPRGLGGVEAGAAGLAALAGHPTVLAAAPFMSPRLMGEVAHGLGAAGRGLAPVTEAVRPAARAATEAVPSLHETDTIAEQGQVPWTVGGGPDRLQDATNALLRLSQPYKDGGAVHDAAHEANPEPTEAQIEAGNYRKGHVKLHGLDISVETPIGAARRGTGKDGKSWENRHETAHYGYVKRTSGADGEHVDCYIGPHHKSRRIFVVNQIDPERQKFDEHKVIFGARNRKDARDIYDGGFSDGSGPKRRWSIHEVTPEGLKHWLAKGNTKRPMQAAA